MDKVIKGRDVALALTTKTKEDVLNLKNKCIETTLAILRVGKKEDDIAYEKSILKNCEKVNIKSLVIELPADISENSFINALEALNTDPSVHGILIFRPLAECINERKVKHLINPDKDVDCMNPINLSKIFEGESSDFLPCTPAAVMEIIDYFDIKIEGKDIVVIGRSIVVGKPLSMMLLNKNATITICHSRTRKLKEISKKADIVIAAIGKERFITNEYIKSGATVIDVGINIDKSGRLCGDVDFDSVYEKASFITPVPGGVGSVTTAILLKQTVNAAKKNLGFK